MARNTYTHYFDDLPWIAKLLLQIFVGSLLGGIYRIARYAETKNTVTLVVAILGLFTGIGNLILWVADLFTLAMYNRISLFAD